MVGETGMIRTQIEQWAMIFERPDLEALIPSFWIPKTQLSPALRPLPPKPENLSTNNTPSRRVKFLVPPSLRGEVSDSQGSPTSLLETSAFDLTMQLQKNLLTLPE